MEFNTFKFISKDIAKFSMCIKGKEITGTINTLTKEIKGENIEDKTLIIKYKDDILKEYMKKCEKFNRYLEQKAKTK